jgi:hypothetical protein
MLNFYSESYDKDFSERYRDSLSNFYQQLHPQAIYTSRLIDTKTITKLLKEKETNEESYILKEIEDLDSLRISSLNLNELKIEVNQTEQEETTAQIEQLPYGVPGSSKK